MKKLLILTLSIINLLFLSSCGPEISVKAIQGDGAEISFTTGFSAAAADTLRSISNLPGESPIFAPQDITLVLKDMGVQDPVAKTPTVTSIQSSGKIPSVKSSDFSKIKVLDRRGKSLKVTIGPKQIQAIYQKLNEESKAYFDMMMIPALIGEKMTVAEYRDLLASMYGPTFADELVGGKLTVTLSSPDGKKTSKETLSLGEILTLSGEKSWTLNW